MRPRVSRSTLLAREVKGAPADSPSLESAKVRCRSCGVSLPKGQYVKPPARFYVCSYCIGDPFWGQDGYLRDMIEEELDDPKTPIERRNLVTLILFGSNRANRRAAARLAYKNGPQQ